MSLRLPTSNTPAGTFLLGLSFGAITMGRVAPMLFAVLAVAAAGKTIRIKLEEKGVLIDRALGITLILASVYFFYLALK